MQGERKLIVAHAGSRHSEYPLPKGCAVDDVMTRSVISLRPDTSLQTATELLFERGIGGAPVLDSDGNLVGVLSKTDLVGQRLLGEAPASTAHSEEGLQVVDGTMVSDVMTRAPVVVRSGTSISDAAALLSRLKLHRLPVVSTTGALLGIVTTSDLVRWVAGLP